MKKISIAAILFIGCFQNSFAQADNTSSPPEKKEKKTEHFIGVQLNGLIRQVFNFNNSTSTANVNPYLVTYNINAIKSGWGIRVGAGYNNTSNNTDDGITVTDTKVSNMQVRLGLEKSFHLSEKWTTGVGVDGLFNMNNDKTSSTIHSFDTVTTETKSKGKGFGGGAMGWLRYNVTPRILIGTEASFYYTSTAQDNTITVTQRSFDPSGFGNSIITTTETKSKPKNSQGVFSSPIVFYLIVKF